jgi:hypothetical protein
LREHLSGKSPCAIALFRDFVKLVKRCGPVRVVPEKTRIAFQVRMSFAAVSLRRDRIAGHVGWPAAWKIRFSRKSNLSRYAITSIRFVFYSRKELDREVLGWLREAYRVGQQRHLLTARVARK